MAQARVLLMVSGGIAAYKSCFLARLLQQSGFSLRVAMTEAATQFVGPVTMRALTGHPVATDLWGEGQSEALDHIEYARWADLVVVAPGDGQPAGQGRRRHRRRHRHDPAAGVSRPGADGSGHERQHVAPPGGAGQPGAAGRARRGLRGPRQRLAGLRHRGHGPHGRARGDHGRGAGAGGGPARARRGRRWPPRRTLGRTPGHRDRRAHPRTHRPGARADQPLQRRHGLRPGRRRGGRRRRGHPDHGPGGARRAPRPGPPGAGGHGPPDGRRGGREPDRRLRLAADGRGGGRLHARGAGRRRSSRRTNWATPGTWSWSAIPTS